MNLKNLTVQWILFKKDFRILIKQEATGDFRVIPHDILQNTEC